MGIKLIAFDLDGTLLDNTKKLSEENRLALCRAVDAGALLVPATGRIYPGIPDFVKALPGTRYFITGNGASVYDREEDKVLCSAELSVELCDRIIRYMDTLPVIYDCYQDDWGFMTQWMQEQVAEYVPHPGMLELMIRLRTPVPELRRYLIDKGRPVMKLQMHFKDIALRDKEMEHFEERFPETLATASLPWNIEINSKAASKGQALCQLCQALNIDLSDTLAFGDGSNDVDMIQTAGIGVAMENGAAVSKAVADWIAPSNEENGLAAGIYKYMNI